MNMNLQNFKTSAWYKAFNIKERIELLDESLKDTLDIDAQNNSKQKLKCWSSQVPFKTDLSFAQRLKVDGLTEDEFCYLLNESAESIQNRCSAPPSWLVELEKVFSTSDAFNNKKMPSPESLPIEEKMAGFLYIIEPIIIQGYNLLQKGIQNLRLKQFYLPFDSNHIQKILLSNLLEQLLEDLSRTMILELNVARLQKYLKGDSAEKRFQSFIERLREYNISLSLLQEYPVLTRQLVIRTEQWLSFNLEFLEHLCIDWKDIKTTFSPQKDPGFLVELNGNIGDSHRGGRSVVLLKFSSGFQLVYKPRSMAVDVHFQELLKWLNVRGNHPSFRTLKILKRAEYGWVEFVAHQSCLSMEQVKYFYQRQGGYLALLYALEAIDFHFENLIAAGEHPVLVDLEALFHPRLERINTIQSDDLARCKMFDSVLRVNLLPQRQLSNEEYKGIDVSGIGAKEGQLSPEYLPYLVNQGTDEMKVSRRRLITSGNHHLPTINDLEVNPLEYTEEIISGFTKIYRLIIQHRDDMLSKNGPLACFGEDVVRVVMRPTRFYGILLTESFHPNVLRDALDRDRLFDRLWHGVKDNPRLDKVIRAEREQLWRGDIPMFTTRPNSCDLWTDTNKKLVNFFEEPSMASVQCRLKKLSEEDLIQQHWFIRSSLSTLAMGEDSAKWPTYLITEPQTKIDRKQLLVAARAIGDRLEKLALSSNDDASWIGLSLIDESYWSFIPLDLDLYNGIPGVTLFLSYLADITKEKRYLNLAKKALMKIRHQVERSKSHMTAIGFGGWGGVIYAMAHLGILWKQPELLNEAEAIVELLPSLIERDEQLDIISGAAGCIGGLLSLYHCSKSQHALTTAINCGNHIISQAKQKEQGIGWVSKNMEETILTGFSHGAAGIAWALMKLYALTGKKYFKNIAIEAISFESSHFSSKYGNWPDLRGNNSEEKFMTAWCHGAPGIGLARLDSLSCFDNPEIRLEINSALKTTIKKGFGGNHSLCHGDLGNLELLLQASQTLDNPEWKMQVDRLSTIILESINKHGWLCGVPLGVETPGLMTGLAGIGYQLLRLAEPERVPSVLVLEPPKINSTKS